MLLLKTKYPLSIYMIFMIMGLELFFLINSSIDKILFYSIITFLFFYVFLGRYACKVIVFEDKVVVRYFFFWYKNICIDLNNVNSIDYAKGFYDFTDEKLLGGFYNFPKYCYDKLLFKTSTEEIEVFINTRVFCFNKLYRVIKERIPNCSHSPGVII